MLYIFCLLQFKAFLCWKIKRNLTFYMYRAKWAAKRGCLSRKTLLMASYRTSSTPYKPHRRGKALSCTTSTREVRSLKERNQNVQLLKIVFKIPKHEKTWYWTSPAGFWCLLFLLGTLPCGYTYWTLGKSPEITLLQVYTYFVSQV